ncbi:hypothetical protein LCGC14_1107330 [marine sediment metagenome]|uniref:Uncharacterized protein n=1 Tax=marine sediment metagenome TaxID=412755 RepID=A0A0F9MCF9_9ZZZZ
MSERVFPQDIDALIEKTELRLSDIHNPITKPSQFNKKLDRIKEIAIKGIEEEFCHHCGDDPEGELKYILEEIKELASY